jgi:hypothetical protein
MASKAPFYSIVGTVKTNSGKQTNCKAGETETFAMKENFLVVHNNKTRGSGEGFTDATI